jgi:hypothetical protein
LDLIVLIVIGNWICKRNDEKREKGTDGSVTISKGWNGKIEDDKVNPDLK